MAERKFETFFYTIDKKIHSVEELDDVYMYVDESLSSYRNYMMCPECNAARLAYKYVYGIIERF